MVSLVSHFVALSFCIHSEFASICSEITFLRLMCDLGVAEFSLYCVPVPFLSFFFLTVWLGLIAGPCKLVHSCNINSYKHTHSHILLHTLQRHAHIKKPSVSSWKAPQCYYSPIQERRELVYFFICGGFFSLLSFLVYKIEGKKGEHGVLTKGLNLCITRDASQGFTEVSDIYLIALFLTATQTPVGKTTTYSAFWKRPIMTA